MRDEFDDLAEKTSRGGSHLRARSAVGKVLPFILAIIVAPVLAIGAVYAISYRGEGSPFDALPTESASIELSDSPSEGTEGATEEPTDAQATDEAEPSESTPAESAEPTEEPTEEQAEQTEESTEPAEEQTEPTEEPSEEPTEEPADGIRKDAAITVLNGSGVNGAAADYQARLAAQGYTNVSIGDYAYATPNRTTMYFKDQSLYATAQNVSQTLVLDWWMESASSVGASDILIVIR